MTESVSSGRLIALAAALSVLTTCQGTDPGPPAVTSAESAPVAPDVAEEAGWQSLSDGSSLEDWRGYRMETIPAGWSAEDGTIHFVPPEEGERGDLITREQYANFELSLEWAVTPGGNSGIMFRVSEDADQAYYSGPEVQILDNEAHRDGLKAETSAGSNYALHGPPTDVTVPVGEFNEARLRVDGDRVTHWLNGQKQIEYTLWTDEWKELVAASKFAAMPGYGLNEKGHIALQDHGNEIWLRNVEIRVLP